MRVASILLPLVLVASAGPARDRPLDARTQADLDKALAGLTPGAPLSCVPLTYSMLATKAYGRTLIYRQGNGTAYRNDTAGGCEGAARGDILVSIQHEGRPCSGDIIRTVDPYARTTTGSCALGQFVPYQKAPAAR